MKVYQRGDFDGSFPENFNWELLESRHLTDVARDLAAQIRNELSQPMGDRVHVPGLGDRVNVPGLRFALCCIAGKAEVL